MGWHRPTRLSWSMVRLDLGNDPGGHPSTSAEPLGGAHPGSGPSASMIAHREDEHAACVQRVREQRRTAAELTSR